MKHKNIYRISISLLLAFVMALPTIAQNTKTFKGVVLDETEQPIIGAAIKVVGTTVGTITDLDGNFTLNVPDGKVNGASISFKMDAKPNQQRGTKETDFPYSFSNEFKKKK